MYRKVKKKKKGPLLLYIHTHMSTQYCARHWRKGKSSQEKSRVNTVWNRCFSEREQIEKQQYHVVLSDTLSGLSSRVRKNHLL